MQLQELDAAMMILISLKELMCDRPASLILAGHLRKRRWGRGRAVRCRPEDMREAGLGNAVGDAVHPLNIGEKGGPEWDLADGRWN